MPKRKSFFERLTGAVNTEDEAFLDEIEETPQRTLKPQSVEDENQDWMEEAVQEEEAAQLTVDLYQTPENIIIKTIVAGVAPDELDVSITREMVTISGRREYEETISADDYFHQELYWGSFTRNILLPEEIDVEMAEASEYHGILTITLPKVDKNRETKLKITSK